MRDPCLSIFCLLGNASTDTRDGSVTAVCGGSVNLACNGTGNPIPSVKWIYPPTVSRQKADNDSQSYTRLGGYKLRYNRHLVNVLPSSRGIYQCLLESGFGDAKKVEFQLSVMCKSFCQLRSYIYIVHYVI